MKAPKSKRLRWSDLTPFPDNPPISHPRIKRMMRDRGGYDPIAIGTPEVADNLALAFPGHSEDTLFILDGNNRYVMAELGGRLKEEIIVKLWTGLTEAEMHERCDDLNDRRTPKPAERFLRTCKYPRKGVVQRSIKDVVEEAGWTIGYERGKRRLACTKELEWIWAGGRRATLEGGNHAGALLRAVQTYEGVFGEESSPHHQASLIKGFGAFWLLYPDADMSGLVAALAGLTSSDLYEKSRARRNDLRLASLYNGVIDVLRNRYNKGRRGGRLPERVIGKGGVASWSE